jgi:hypothetical protein
MIKVTTSTNVPNVSCGEWSLYVEASVASATPANKSTGFQFFLNIKFWFASILRQPFSITIRFNADSLVIIPP